MSDYYIGLMSGTSVDAIDAVLVSFDGDVPRLIHSLSYPWPTALRKALLSIAVRPDTALATYARLDVEAGVGFAAAVTRLLAEAGMQPQRIRAIGSHGQTVLHLPDSPAPTSLQIGDAHRIAAITGISVVADFRRRDMAAGGQGAPLAPLYHRALFGGGQEDRAVLNVGGIANLTLLPGKSGGAISGFDTGPGNTLMDAWAARHLDCPFDRDGAWATTGTVDEGLLNTLLGEPYFQRVPPKSTGRELFNVDWLDTHLRKRPHPALRPQDVQATLLALTARSIARALNNYLPQVDRLLVCGGGVYNTALMSALAQALPGVALENTEAHGLHPQWVEATTFAWLAKQAMEGVRIDTPPVTGASTPVILGIIYPA